MARFARFRGVLGERPSGAEPETPGGARLPSQSRRLSLRPIVAVPKWSRAIEVSQALHLLIDEASVAESMTREGVYK